MSKQSAKYLKYSRDYLLEMARHRLVDNVLDEFRGESKGLGTFSQLTHIADLLVAVQCLNEYADLEEDE